MTLLPFFLRFAVCDLRFAVCDLRFAVCDLQFAINYALCIMKNSAFLSTIPAIVIFLVSKRVCIFEHRNM